MGKLTALKVQRAKPGRHGDGGGLYLVVSDTGARKWVLRIQKNGTRHDLGLGSANDVPLSDRTVEILRRMEELRRSDSPNAFVFEGRKQDRPLSDMSLSMPIRRAELGITVHGFRSSFRDWAAERTSFPRELAEKALAHAVRNKVEAAYQRGDLFDKRRKLMDAWAQYCQSARDINGNVTSIHGAAV